MNPIDNVERRESDPHAHAKLVAPDHDTQDLYDRHLNAVCHAIRSTPAGLVDATFVIQVLNTLASGACTSGKYQLAAVLDTFSDSL